MKVVNKMFVIKYKYYYWIYKYSVYKIISNDSQLHKIFTSQTGGYFLICFKEHTRNIKNINPASSFATHIQNRQHTYRNINNNNYISPTHQKQKKKLNVTDWYVTTYSKHIQHNPTTLHMNKRIFQVHILFHHHYVIIPKKKCTRKNKILSKVRLPLHWSWIGNIKSSRE